MKMIHVSINLTEHGMEGGGLILCSRNVSFSGSRHNPTPVQWLWSVRFPFG